MQMPMTRLWKRELAIEYDEPMEWEREQMKPREALLLSTLEGRASDLMRRAHEVRDVASLTDGLTIQARSCLRTSRVKLQATLEVIDELMSQKHE
jgi:hypothetical protein